MYPERVVVPDGLALPVRLTRRRAATRDRLLDAAAEVFAERGVEGASVEDVCDRAGFTRGAFYSNFAARDELVLALVERRAARLLDRVRAAVDDAVAELHHRPAAVAGQRDQPRDQLRHQERAGGDAVVDAVTRFPFAEVEDRAGFLLNTELTLHALRHPAAADAIAGVRSAMRAQLVRLLRGALEASGRSLSAEPAMVARLVSALFDGSTAQSLLEPDALPPGTLERQFLAPLLMSLSEPLTGPPRPA